MVSGYKKLRVLCALNNDIKVQYLQNQIDIQQWPWMELLKRKSVAYRALSTRRCTRIDHTPCAFLWVWYVHGRGTWYIVILLFTCCTDAPRHTPRHVGGSVGVDWHNLCRHLGSCRSSYRPQADHTNRGFLVFLILLLLLLRLLLLLLFLL